MIQVDIGYVRKRRQRALDQAHSRSCRATLVGHNPEQMQRIGVIRAFIEGFAVKRLGPPQPSGLMMSKSGAHGSQPACLLPHGSVLSLWRFQRARIDRAGARHDGILASRRLKPLGGRRCFRIFHGRLWDRDKTDPDRISFRNARQKLDRQIIRRKQDGIFDGSPGGRRQAPRDISVRGHGRLQVGDFNAGSIEGLGVRDLCSVDENRNLTSSLRVALRCVSSLIALAAARREAHGINIHSTAEF